MFMSRPARVCASSNRKSHSSENSCNVMAFFLLKSKKASSAFVRSCSSVWPKAARSALQSACTPLGIACWRICAGSAGSLTSSTLRRTSAASPTSTWPSGLTPELQGHSLGSWPEPPGHDGAHALMGHLRLAVPQPKSLEVGGQRVVRASGFPSRWKVSSELCQWYSSAAGWHRHACHDKAVEQEGEVDQLGSSSTERRLWLGPRSPPPRPHQPRRALSR